MYEQERDFYYIISNSVMSKEDLNNLLLEFKDENSSLVYLALENCIKLYGDSSWRVMAFTDQVNSIFCWIAGLKKANEKKPYFIIEEKGWPGAWKVGKTIKLDITGLIRERPSQDFINSHLGYN